MDMKKGVFVPASYVRYFKNNPSRAILAAAFALYQRQAAPDGFFSVSVDRINEDTGLIYANQRAGRIFFTTLGILEEKSGGGRGCISRYKFNAARLGKLIEIARSANEEEKRIERRAGLR